MAGSSTWTWTLVLAAGRVQDTIPGRTMAPANATEDTILPDILKDLRNGELRGVDFSVVSFSATRTS